MDGAACLPSMSTENSKKARFGSKVSVHKDFICTHLSDWTCSRCIPDLQKSITEDFINIICIHNFKGHRCMYCAEFFKVLKETSVKKPKTDLTEKDYILLHEGLKISKEKLDRLNFDFDLLEDDNTEEMLSNFKDIINEKIEDCVLFLQGKGESLISIKEFVTNFFKKFEPICQKMIKIETDLFQESFLEELQGLDIDEQFQRVEQLMGTSKNEPNKKNIAPKVTNCKRKRSLGETPQHLITEYIKCKPKDNKKPTVERPLSKREENEDNIPVSSKLKGKNKGENLSISDANGTKRDFYKLEDETNKEIEKHEENRDLDTIQAENGKSQKKTRSYRPPPIFIRNVTPDEVKGFLTELNVGKECSLKIVSKSQIKILTKTEEFYKKLLAALNLKEYEYYTFQNFHGKIATRLIKGLPANYDKNRLKNGLESLEFLEIKNITQISHRINKTPLPIFRIDFRWYNKLEEKLEKIKKIDDFEVTFEDMDISLVEIPICKSCLNYGHTKRYCKLKITCIICNEHHFSDKCSLVEKARLENAPIRPKCLHCGESHFSTWKGCPYYKKLRKQKIEQFKKQHDPGVNKQDKTEKCERGNENENTINKDDEIRRLKNYIQVMETKHNKERLQLQEEINSLKKEIQEIKSCLHLMSQSKVSP